MYDHAHAYRKISKVINPKFIGEVIGAGFNSLVIEPISELCYKNSVLIVTSEKEKRIFLKKMFGREVSVIKKSLIGKESRKIINMVEEDFSVFYMKKLTPIDYEDIPTQAIGFMNCVNNRFTERYHKDDLFWIIEEMKEILEHFKKKDCMPFYRSIKKSLRALEKSSIDSLFTIDIHTGQFMTDNGKVVCIDPVLFNYMELQKKDTGN